MTIKEIKAAKDSWLSKKSKPNPVSEDKKSASPPNILEKNMPKPVSYSRDDSFQKRMTALDNMPEKERKLLIDTDLKQAGFKKIPTKPLSADFSPTVYGWEQHLLDEMDDM